MSVSVTRSQRQPAQVAATVPAPTLAYVRPGALPRRPALLLVLAVASLVYASASMLLGVGIFAFHAGVWWLEPSLPKVVTPAPLPPVKVEPYDGDPASVDGLKHAQRESVVRGVRERLKLPPDRAAMLERLLADVGARIFPRDATRDPLDANLITGTGRIAGPDGDGPRASHWFTTPRGRVELSDFAATFHPDGSTRAVRLVRNVVYDGDAPPRWSAIAIGELLDRLNRGSGGMMTAEQGTVLLRELRDSVATDSGNWYAAPELHAGFGQHGIISCWLHSREARWWVLRDGRTIDVASAPHGVDAITGVPHVRVAAPTYVYWPGSGAAVALLAIAGLLNAILAAYLFGGAILLLREQPFGADRHTWFLTFKVPLLLLGAFALLWWCIRLDGYATTPTIARDVSKLAPLILILSMIYPVATALVLRGWRVRQYLASRGQDPWYALRAMHDRLARFRFVRLIGFALIALMAAHALLMLLSMTGSPRAPVRALVHAFAAGICGAIAIVMLRAWPWRLARARVTQLATCVGIMLTCGAAFAPTTEPARSAPPTPLTPWAVEDLLAQARGPDVAQARGAVRRLARARDAGQEALLRLLEGPLPPMGIEGALVAIGQEWFDTDARWAEHYRPRAMRLLLEWIEVIERTDDVRAIAAFEAMGAGEELEPLLRPLLVAQHPHVRRRASGMLRRINPQPIGIVRLLERDLRAIDERRDGERRERIIEALVRLRPTADATLARLLLDADSRIATLTFTALLGAGGAPSQAMLDAALQRLDAPEQAQELRERAARLARLSREGRAQLIERSVNINSTPAADTAAWALRSLWPHTGALFRRLRGAALTQGSEATRRVLLALNDQADLGPLTASEDDELRTQALILLAQGEYAVRLGPVTRQQVNVVPPHHPAPPARWRSATAAPGREASALSRMFSALPPAWASVAVCGMSASVLLVIVLRLFPRRAGGERDSTTLPVDSRE